MVSVYAKARRAQESQYRDLCTISEYRDVVDEKSRLTRKEEVVVLENLECRLSFENLSAASQTDTGAAVVQSVKLFIAPEVRIKSGSKVTVTLTDGKVEEYALSGIPAVYPTHQEILLEPFRGWA